MKIWLIGAGKMSIDYANVLDAIGCDYSVIGRGVESALKFEQDTGIPVVTGGVELAIEKSQAPDLAIVAVGILETPSVAMALVRAGVPKLLLEKPGALYLDQLEALQEEAALYRAEVTIAYNRRFYASVDNLQNLVAEEGGIKSARFEFTEWAHKIIPLNFPTSVKDRWVLANSSHVLDLVFYLIGLPKDWYSWTAGTLTWHKSSARFFGAGKTEKNICFSYLSDFESAGRWCVEIMTEKHKYILSPLETICRIPIGSVDSEPTVFDDSIDKKFKAGLFKQTLAFMSDEKDRLCTLSDQIKNFSIYEKIAGYE
jgi:predicted dehydrogenase